MPSSPDEVHTSQASPRALAAVRADTTQPRLSAVTGPLTGGGVLVTLH